MGVVSLGTELNLPPFFVHGFVMVPPETHEGRPVQMYTRKLLQTRPWIPDESHTFFTPVRKYQKM